MVTIIKSKNSEQDVLFQEAEELVFNLPANDNISALMIDDVGIIANDNEDELDEGEIGISLQSEIFADDETNIIMSAGYPLDEDAEELDFSQPSSGTRGYLREDYSPNRD
ncbi:MAG: hypothetical protein V7727_02435 [Sneathiella sp.]